MARARNIKPAFFKNADLVETAFETRLLFAGLWTLADREGRLLDRPKQIKMELFPADDININDALNSLASIGLIHRYEAAGVKCIEVVNFEKHQNPHKAEQESTLPDRDGNIASTEKARCKHGASTVQEAGKEQPKQLHAGLIPDSLLLIPEEDMAETGVADFVPPSTPADANSVQTSQPVDACPHQDIVALFAEVLPSARQVRDWTPARQQLLRARWREDKKRQDLAWWRRFFGYVGQSDFLMGRVSAPGRKPFELGLEWLLKSENFAKVREGAYHEAEVAA